MSLIGPRPERPEIEENLLKRESHITNIECLKARNKWMGSS